MIRKLKKSSPFLALGIAILLYVVFSLFLLPDYRWLLNSDNSIPWIMTQEPWIKQDFFYWGAERFGAPYMVSWKLLAEPFFKNPSTLYFYQTFIFLYFVALSLWLFTLRAWNFRIFFLLLFLPLSLERIDLFLFPGHVYGTLFFFGAVLFLIAENSYNKRELPNTAIILLAALAALAYWQHLLVGVIYLAVAIAYVLELKKSRRDLVLFFSVFFVLFVAIEIARSWARHWSTPLYMNFAKLDQWPRHFSAFWQNGALSFERGNLFGNCYFIFFLLGPLIVIFRNWRLMKSDFRLRLSALLWALCVMSLLSVMMHEWYAKNGFHRRYFAFLMPLSLVVFYYQWPFLSEKIQRFQNAAGLLLLCFGATHLMNSTEFVLGNTTLLKQVEKQFHARVDLIDKMHDLKCQAFIDWYGNSYVFVSLSEGKIMSSANDYSRNPLYLAKVKAMRPLCEYRDGLAILVK